MSFIECILLSVALAADCFSIGITCGIIEKRFNAAQALVMALLFGFFQAAMPVVSWGASVLFNSNFEALGAAFKSFGHWMAFILLLIVGARMVWESLHESDERAFDARRPATLLYLAVATSIDALAVGITFTCVGLDTVASVARPVAIIGAGSFLFTLAGKWIGAVVGRRFNINAELAGGIILILLGVKIVAVG